MQNTYNSIFYKFCLYVDKTIFSKKNVGGTIAFIVDQAFIDEFCRIEEITEDHLLRDIRCRLYSTDRSHLHIKGILAIQLFAASKREDSGGITETNYRDRLSQVLNWDINDLQSWMIEFQEYYWTSLYRWCNDNGFKIAKCRPKTGSGRFVQYPVQQANRVFTLKDLKYISYHFVENNLQPGEDIQERDFWKILKKHNLNSYVHTQHGKRLIQNPEYVQDAYAQIFNHYLRWDGSYLNPKQNRAGNIESEKSFLHLTGDYDHIDIKDINFKKLKRLNLSEIDIHDIQADYRFKRANLILFKRYENYNDYWEETRYLEDKEDGIAIVFRSSAIYSTWDSSSRLFSHLKPVYKTSELTVYRFSYSPTLATLYTERKFFSLIGGLKIGRMQYLVDVPPTLKVERDSLFWIDGEQPQKKLINGELPLDFLDIGHHEIKFPNHKAIEFEIVNCGVSDHYWDTQYNKWTFNRNENLWATIPHIDSGVVGLDFSCIPMDSESGDDNNIPILTRWAQAHLIGERIIEKCPHIKLITEN